MPVLLFQPTVNPRASYSESLCIKNLISQLGKRRSYEKCRHNISVFGRGLGGAGGTFRLLNESLTFKSPDA